MATIKANARLKVGSAPWVEEERASTLQIAEAETEEFTFSARNEVDWLNEHMADIFSKNQVNVAEIFKTPGKLRGKTPRTARKTNPMETRAPLSDVFSATPQDRASPFRQIHFERPVSTFQVAEDPMDEDEQVLPIPSTSNEQLKSPPKPLQNAFDSGYHGSQADDATQSNELAARHQLPRISPAKVTPVEPTVLPELEETEIEEDSDENVVILGRDTEEPEERRITEKSFKSGQGEHTRKMTRPVEPDIGPDGEDEEKEGLRRQQTPQSLYPVLESPLQSRGTPDSPYKRSPQKSSPARQSLPTSSSRKAIKFITDAEEVLEEEDVHLADAPSPSEGSSPIRPIGVRPSKSFASSSMTQAQPGQQTQLASQEPRQKPPERQNSPERKSRLPGAFPDDEDDSWIGPPPAPAAAESSIFSPRIGPAKVQTTDAMEQNYINGSICRDQFFVPKRGDQQPSEPLVGDSIIYEKTKSTLGHMKSASTSYLVSPNKAGEQPAQKKPISVSNPTPSVHTIAEDEEASPPKSPSRNCKGSPLKAAKDKFSSILKTSRGLFASSAAVSADAKTSALSAANNMNTDDPSLEDILSKSNNKGPSYPNLNAHHMSGQQLHHHLVSPPKASVRKTRASTEKEEKRKEEEAKDARKMNDQLEKVRMKVREDARIFHLEQERVATMQKEVMARKEQERQAKIQAEIQRSTRTSPRKTKAQLEAEGIAAAAASTHELSGQNVDMSEASQAMPPPSIPRPKSQIGRPGAKRLLKASVSQSAMRGKPTVIRVDTGSQRGHHPQPSNATLAASLQDSLASSQQSASSQGLKHKASMSSVQSKSSTNSFKSAASKALESAARKKEQDELAAQRKREAKQEVERQRAAIKEEERRKEELQRRQDVERQREARKENERAAAAADAKRAASRQAIEKRRLEMEKAKETRAPPPAARTQANCDITHAMLQDKALPPAPQHRTEMQSKRPNPAAQRPQEDLGRATSSMLHNNAKATSKRPFQQDAEDYHSRPTLQRNGMSYQDQQSKRARTTEDFDENDDMTEDHPNMTAPPIRQSSIRPKDAPTKSLFPSGYANAPQSSSLQRSTLISQQFQMNQSKVTHPMDMAQVSKAPITFASSSSQPYKTPARPGAQKGGKIVAKSAAKSSPRYQNGESIELPEIHTDSEDEDSDAGGEFPAVEWTNSPALRERLITQEGVNPADIFGQPGALNMEEVFSKSKDRFHKFRARTSSANWTGQDRLTEDEIRKDLEGRDKLRRQGGWTYDSMV
ncbi:inner centromere protein [Diplocarpon rosae]|nr:inner centromere protein [Diplocarpon rosae]